MQSSPGQDLSIAVEIAKKAAAIVSGYFNQQPKVTIKNNDPFNFLSQADQKSDDYITDSLRKMFPNDQILSEEGEKSVLDYDGRVWMVDPLDGTKEFINGGTNFSVMVGLCVNGVPTLGCVISPIDSSIYWAEKGKGSFMTSSSGATQKLQVNRVSELNKARIILSTPHGEARPAEDFLMQKFNLSSKLLGASIGLRVAEIAQQKAEFFINTNVRACKWDTCAPQIILEEAGGKMTDIYGQSLNYKKDSITWADSFVASNAVLHEGIITSIKGIKQLLI